MTQSKKQYTRDLKDKDVVQNPFLIKFSALAVGKNGKPYMNLVLMDKTGEVEARLWEDAEKYATLAVRDAFVFVMNVLREDEVDVRDYIAEGEVDAEALYAQLLGYVASMQDPYYKALAESILRDDAEIVDRIKRAPAAKSMHHAYRGGLLEHVISITGILDHMARHYGKYVDRDLLFLGGFLHDIGKIWELSYERVTDYTTEGKLIGHLVMGSELVEKKVRALEAEAGRLPGPFPDEQRLLVKHLILSHHGKYEYASPKRPKCLEALIVHMIDDLDSKVNAIQKFTLQDPTPGKWTGLNRQFERFFYKPDWAMPPSDVTRS